MEAAGKLDPTSRERALYYERLKPYHLAPLWERLHDLLTPEPHNASRPCLWSYRAIRPMLLEAAKVISAKEAERRVLILENPGLAEQSAVTETLYAGLQLIMPGEIARSHRHSSAALRFILEGSRAYTAVNGERAYMEPGDLILTPAWTWHDHGHEGQGPMVWLDVLDLPLVEKMGPIFFEPFAAERHPVTQPRPPADSELRYAYNLIPADSRRELPSHPVFHFPYRRSREALSRLAAVSTTDVCHGIKLEYIDPMTGGTPMPTISMFLQWLPAGFEGQRYQTTEGTIVCVAEGTGRVIVGEGPQEAILAWQPHDVFVVPCWKPYRLEADQEAVLFSASDKVVQTRLGLWRERRIPAPAT